MPTAVGGIEEEIETLTGTYPSLPPPRKPDRHLAKLWSMDELAGGMSFLDVAPEKRWALTTGRVESMRRETLEDCVQLLQSENTLIKRELMRMSEIVRHSGLYQSPEIEGEGEEEGLEESLLAPSTTPATATPVAPAAQRLPAVPVAPPAPVPGVQRRVAPIQAQQDALLKRWGLTKKFSGDPSEVPNFMAQITICMEQTGHLFASDRERVLYICRAFTGKAGEWLIQLQAAQAPELNHLGRFLTALRRRFEDPGVVTRARAQLGKVRQGTRSLGEYALEFRGIAGLLPDWPEQFKITCFQQGMRRDLWKLAFARGDPNTLDGWIQHAGNIEAQWKAVDPEFERKPDTLAPAPRKLPSKGGDERFPRAVKRVCFHCGEPGHFAPSCPKPPAAWAAEPKKPTGAPQKPGTKGKRGTVAAGTESLFPDLVIYEEGSVRKEQEATVDSNKTPHQTEAERDDEEDDEDEDEAILFRMFSKSDPMELELRDYQWKVIGPALEGKNIIIWLPTGAGKTRAAVYVCKRHLESQDKNKVVVLANTVPLVDQHLKNEFSFLQSQFRITALCGDRIQKIFFSEMVKCHDLIICTPQILYNALTHQEEEMRVELTDFSLLVIDECHHTHKGTVYNKIMEDYLDRKLKGQQGLPQILGLTASLGTGSTNSLEAAKNHILEICANLDTEKIMSPDKHKPSLDIHVPCPKKQYDLSEPRLQDPFGEKLKEIMTQIYSYLNMPNMTTDFGTKLFEQQIVELEKEGAKEFCQKTRVCALHLRKYNDALLTNETVRMIDAFNILDKFYQLECATKMLTQTSEKYLVQIFNENRLSLLALAEDSHYENPKLSKLQQVLRDQFQELKSSRGIVFTRTRQSAYSLHQWVLDNQALCKLGIKTDVLIGASSSNQTTHMTQQEQQDVIHRFRKGALNLLFSTSVAEEGLDIPECNIVVRYGLMTNEIAMMQARGRARAPNSICSILAKTNSKEVARERLNETLETLMESAITWVQELPEKEYHLKIVKLQHEAMISRKLRDAKCEKQRQLHDPDSVRLCCLNCNMAVCHGSDLRKVENMHHVNISSNFSLYYKTSLNHVSIAREFKDWKPGSSISCNKCGQAWGMEMIYRDFTLPVLAIKNFVVETPDGRQTPSKWSKVTFEIKAFDYTEYCNTNFWVDM
ncbi:probable ATP-dependent RNA helicase DHX58 isoform X2 [Python bivittatus]|uniref:RNA helicase n=1 Tax=Python bivittatus TaxID=176946 RepID=A0A9F5J923_PYTBI|nr:probable ATP-dependent RNA helicase DHX58 isoform X2 [Python bivittatus]